MDKPKTVRFYDNVVALPRDQNNAVIWREVHDNFKHGPANIRQLKVMTAELHQPNDGPTKTANAAYLLDLEGAEMPVELLDVLNEASKADRKAAEKKAKDKATKDEPEDRETARPLWWAAMIDRRQIPNNGNGWLTIGLGLTEDEVRDKVKDWYDSHDWVVEGRPAHAR